MASILLPGFGRVAIPLIGKYSRFLRTDSNLFVAAKAFAAGVILATGFVHMLSDANDALNDPCLSSFPWSKFPFTGFFAMMAALFTLLLDFVGTQYYERKQSVNRAVEEQTRVGSLLETGEESSGIGVGVGGGGKVFGEEESGGMHIVGMHAHAAHHRHNHPHGQDACGGSAKQQQQHGHGHAHAHAHGHAHGHGHGHAHSHNTEIVEDEPDVRHVVVSQVTT